MEFTEVTRQIFVERDVRKMALVSHVVLVIGQQIFQSTDSVQVAEIISPWIKPLQLRQPLDYFRVDHGSKWFVRKQ
jgi:hypothetical protein